MTWAILLQVNMTMANPIVAGGLIQETPIAQTSHEILHHMQMHTTTAKRLRKRHSSFQDIVSKELNTPFALDWSNPCGGMWLGDKHKNKHKKQSFKKNKSLRIVKNAALREYRSLPLKTKALNTSDIRTWIYHNNSYTFLPTINLNSNITLRTWHRHLQIYVATFGYLQRASLYADQTGPKFETDLSKVLRHLKLSARNVLCEIESAINATTKLTTTTPLVVINKHKQKQSHNINEKLKKRLILNIRPKVMLERLQFQMPFKGQLNTENGTIEWNTSKLQLNAIDLKFAKHRYLQYLRGIVAVLKKHRVVRQKPATYTQTYTQKHQ